MASTQHRKRFLLHGSNALVLTLAVIGIAVVGYVLVDRYRPFRIDLTKSGLHSLAPKTIELLERLDRDVQVTFFEVPRQLSPDADFVNRKVTDLLEEYQVRSKGKIRYDITNPLRDEIRLQELGGDLGAAVFQSGDQKIVVQAKEIFQTDFAYGGDPSTKFTGEEAFDTALLRLMEDKSRVACFLAGHAEASIEDPEEMGYAIAKDLLRRENFEAREVRLSGEPGGPAKLDGPLDLSADATKAAAAGVAASDVPAACNVLVIAGPQAQITAADADAVVRFFEKGNGVVLLAEPMTSSGVEALARRLGVEVLPGVAADPVSQRRSPLAIVPTLLRHEIVTAMAAMELPILLPRAVGLRQPADGDPAFRLTPLMETSASGLELVDIKDGAADPESKNNIPGPIVLGYAVEKDVAATTGADGAAASGADDETAGMPAGSDGPAPKRTARAVVIGDADFARNASLQALAMQGAAGNGDLLKNAVNWTAGASEKIGIGPKDPSYATVTITDRSALWVLLGTGLLMPAGIFSTGIAIWLKRRRR